MTASKAAPRISASLNGQATTTSSTSFARLQRSTICCVIGIPQRGKRALPGKRVDPMRCWMMQTVFMLTKRLLLKKQLGQSKCRCRDNTLRDNGNEGALKSLLDRPLFCLSQILDRGA